MAERLRLFDLRDLVDKKEDKAEQYDVWVHMADVVMEDVAFLKQSHIATRIKCFELNYDGVGGNILDELLGCVGHFTNLLRLVITEVFLSVRHLTTLCHSIQQGTRLLRLLNLSKNFITSEGVKAIAPAIKSSNSLARVMLIGNRRVGLDCVPLLLDAIKCHRTMRAIDLVGTSIDDYNRVPLEDALRRLRSKKARVLILLLVSQKRRRPKVVLNVDLVRKLGEMLEHYPQRH
jgi:hypothetical protein